MKQGLIDLEEEFCVALEKDLGKCIFMNKLQDLSGCILEIDHVVSHLASWMKDEHVDSPVLLAPAKTLI